MGKKNTVVSFPDYKEVLMFGTGFIMGLVAPTLFFGMIAFSMQSGLLTGSISSRLKGIAAQDPASSAYATIVISIVLIITLYAIDKATLIVRKIGWGVAAGMLFRVLFIGLLGINLPIPFVGAEEVAGAAPGNMTNSTNITNSTVNDTIGALPG